MVTLNQKKLVVYTDGGSRGNPGPAAIGVVVQDASGHALKSYGESIGVATNNEAEYRAVAFALQKIKAFWGKKETRRFNLKVYMDSELVIKQLTGKYKVEEERLFPLFIKIWNLKMDFGSIVFEHVPRERNKEADRLVNEALDKQQTKLFGV